MKSSNNLYSDYQFINKNVYMEQFNKFEPTFEQINDDIKPAWEDIKKQSEDLVNKLGCPRSFIGGMLHAIASDFADTRRD